MSALSPTLLAHDRRRALQRSNPLLALAYEVEAVGDGRAENDQCAYAKLATLAAHARAAVEQEVGAPFFNDLYPPNARVEPERNAHVAEPFRSIVNAFAGVDR